MPPFTEVQGEAGEGRWELSEGYFHKPLVDHSKYKHRENKETNPTKYANTTIINFQNQRYARYPDSCPDIM